LHPEQGKGEKTWKVEKKQKTNDYLGKKKRELKNKKEEFTHKGDNLENVGGCASVLKSIRGGEPGRFVGAWPSFTARGVGPGRSCQKGFSTINVVGGGELGVATLWAHRFDGGET